jgi:hypothetical protein
MWLWMHKEHAQCMSHIALGSAPLELAVVPGALSIVRTIAIARRQCKTGTSLKRGYEFPSTELDDGLQ